MEKITEIAKLLGEENEKRLKDGIVDLLLEHVRYDLEDSYDCVIDYDRLLDEIEYEIKASLKDKYKKIYMEKLDKKFDKLLVESFGD